ncbi:unnamed protein product, partial [Rotaria magnacalcarata]
NPLSLSDDEYQILTSLTKVQFEDLASYLFDSNIRNSSNRSIRNALAILLCKLRLGLSLNILAVLFQLPDKKAVSRSLKTVRTALMTRFVPSNLGFNHITRQEIIDQHTSTMARRLMCDAESNTAIVVIDGTYIYIQKSRNNEFQRNSFNLYKKRSLLKPMIIVSTTGYVIACIGPFCSNYSNNDASIMNNILHRNTENILNWLKKDDIVVVDRGFRDSVHTMESLGLNVVLPPFLNGRRQFTTTEVNQSKYVTKVRWVVEAVNSRIKQFKYLANTIPNSALPHLEHDVSIVCAIINRYRPPIKTSNAEDVAIAEKMILLRSRKNNFEKATAIFYNLVRIVFPFQIS